MLSEDKRQLFEQMHQELWEYNRALERGEKPQAPNYDPELLAEFRIWQERRMIEAASRARPRPGSPSEP